MRGRTNVIKSTTDTKNEGININGNIKSFTIADGCNVDAGNFVQYEFEKNDVKYDTNSVYENIVQKVLPCGNNKYIRRYTNYEETKNTYWFNLIDVNNGFNVLFTFSISSENPPSFCLLNDGNIAICYMEEMNTFTISIYNITDSFSLLNTYKMENENIKDIDTTHIAQLGNSKIVAVKTNSLFICDYNYGEITENKYINLGITMDSFIAHQIGDNDWNLYPIENNKFIFFPAFSRVNMKNYFRQFFAYLIEISGNESKVLDSIKISDTFNSGSYKTINMHLWGNAFGIHGKILFSNEIEKFYETNIYYVKNDHIMQSPSINLLEIGENAFSDLNFSYILKNINSISNSSSGTAQYVRENVFYVSITPQLGIYNPKSKTAIYRMEYNQSSGTFDKSNIVTFDGDDSNYRFGFGQFFESEDGDVYYLYETSSSTNGKNKTGRWLMKLTYKNGILEIGENTGMVKNYFSDGSAIGVAKQSGKAGDIIEVYTPSI